MHLPNLGPRRLVHLLAAGLLLISASLYLAFLGFPYLINYKIKSSIALNNGTMSMKSFEKLSSPLEFRIFVFNVTNPEEVTQGAKPILQEVGPYIYDEYREKVDMTAGEGDTLTYKVKKTFFFNADKSGRHQESDILTVLNIPMLGTGFIIEERFPLGLAFLNSAIPFLYPNVTTPFLQVSVGQLLFHGVPIKCGYETGPAMPICRGIKNNMPPSIRQIPGTEDFGFSIFQKVNGTPSGEFKVSRGNGDIYSLGQILAYENQTYLTTWERNSSCALLRGTDSSILPPLRGREDIYLYLPEVCLSLRAKFTGETDAYGIHVFKYEPSPENFASPSVVKENVCRCKKVDGQSEPVCLKSGAIDASKCQGAPVILTPAHFLDSDPEYRDYALGLSPDPAKHQTQVLIEPKTGVPVAAYKRIQMNMFLRRLEGIALLKNVSEGLFPMVWVEEALTDEIRSSYLSSLQGLSTGVRVLSGVSWLVGSSGLVCLLAGLIFYLNYHKLFCFRASNAVTNISIASSGRPTKGGVDFLNEKNNTIYNVPITTATTTTSHSSERMGSFNNKNSELSVPS